MSELIDNSRKRVDTLKALIVGLHRGSPVDDARKQLEELLDVVPYGEVVQAEQELVAEGLPETEIVQYCDLHSAALRGMIAQGPNRPIPAGHPVHTFREEDKAIASQLERLRSILKEISRDEATSPAEEAVLRTPSLFNMLTDIEKHYARRENLLFPFLCVGCRSRSPRTTSHAWGCAGR